MNFLFNINLINLLFMHLTFVIVVLGTLMTLIEKYLPTAIRQTFRYGKHAHKEKSDKLVEKLELPKSYFAHFYVFAVVWSWAWLILAVSVYFFGYQLPSAVVSYLDFSCGDNRKAETSPFITLTALALMTAQCTRRFIESNFLQIFSKKSKMNISHYLCGYLHYYGVLVLIVAKGEGFIRGQSNPTITFPPSDVLLAIITTAIFVYFSIKQFETNKIFINLRKNKSGAVVTEKHLVPKGGLFKYLSSPHMTCEVALYAMLYLVIAQNSSYIYCFAWVVTNQFSNSLLTHRWYKETFPNYPKERKAFIPFLI